MAIDWNKVRSDYEKKNLSFDRLSKAHGLEVETLRKRASKEGWEWRKKAEPAKKLIKEHRRLWRTVKKRLCEGLKKNDEKDLKLVKIAGDVLLDVVKGEREAWGLKIDEFEPDRGETTDITAAMEYSTVSLGADKAVDRG